MASGTLLVICGFLSWGEPPPNYRMQNIAKMGTFKPDLNYHMWITMRKTQITMCKT